MDAPNQTHSRGKGTSAAKRCTNRASAIAETIVSVVLSQCVTSEYRGVSLWNLAAANMFVFPSRTDPFGPRWSYAA